MTILSNRVCDVIGNVTNSHSVPSLIDTFRGTGTFLAFCSSLRHTYSNERKGFFKSKEGNDILNRKTIYFKCKSFSSHYEKATICNPSIHEQA